MRKLFLILSLFVVTLSNAQTGSVDSLRKAELRRADSIRVKMFKDSVAQAASDSVARQLKRKDSLRLADLAGFSRKIDSSIYAHNPFFRFTNPSRLIVTERQWKGKEGFFYCIIALLLFFALVKNAFSRYLNDLFQIFFRTTLKQRQMRDQLINAPLPSLLFNILYLLSASLFISLLLQHFKLGGQFSFWLLYAYCLLGLLLIYMVKFITLKLCGWMMRASEATDTYIFIVFTTNKIIGILLLPFIIALAFGGNLFYQAAFVLSITMVGMLFAYRFYLSYVSVHKLIKIDIFHFLLYLLALEIIPLLLINKLLVKFFSETY